MKQKSPSRKVARRMNRTGEKDKGGGGGEERLIEGRENGQGES